MGIAELKAGGSGQGLPERLTGSLQDGIGCAVVHDSHAPTKAELFASFDKIPTDFGLRVEQDLLDFLASGIASDLEPIAKKSAKDDGTIGGASAGSNRCQLKVAGLGLASVAVEGAGERRAPGCVVIFHEFRLARRREELGAG